MQAVAVVPLAGSSSRMGVPKWCLPFGSTTLLGAVVRALREGGVAVVAVVAAPGDEALAGWVRDRGLLLTVNPQPARGMLSSVLAGIEALGGVSTWEATERALLVCPADLPALASETVATVLQAVQRGPARLAVPRWHHRRGHPLAVAAELVAEIPALEPTVGLRQLLDRHRAGLVELPVEDPGCVHDVDTPEDYARLTSRLGGLR